MDFQRGLVLFSLVILCSCPVHVLCEQLMDDGNTTQYGGMNCILRGNLLDVSVFVFKNQSNITGVEFTKYDDFKVRYRTGDCVFTGDGTENNPFTASTQVDVTTDGAATGKTFCGHMLTSTSGSDPKLYSWVVHTYQSLNNDVFGDLYIRFTCASTDLPGLINISYGVQPETTKQLTANHGILKLDCVSSSNVVTTRVDIGTLIRLQLEYTPSTFNTSDGHDTALRPRGVYCESLYVKPDASSTRRLYMQDANGCPLTNISIGQPATSFVNQNAQNKYQSRTGDFKAFRFDALENESIQPDVGVLFFVCEAEFCVRPDNTLCDNRCTTSGRRRRETDENDEFLKVTVVTTLEVVDPSKEKESSLATEYIIALSVGVAVLLLATLVCVICMCIRTQRRAKSADKYHRHSNSSSVTSSAKSQKTSSGRSFDKYTDHMNAYSNAGPPNNNYYYRKY